MSEYWKSIPKKFCDVCKCWFTDNKASVEFHERGLRHQNNVKKKLAELTKRNQVQKHATDKYNAELMKIEAAAMGAFAKDIAADPTKARELSTSKSFASSLKEQRDKPSTSLGGSRFGGVSNLGSDESATVQWGKEKALDTITTKMEKKAQWLESKTAEGKPYYWNRKTLETKWEPPKAGYLTMEEQQKLGINRDNVPLIGVPGYKHNPYGQWQSVSEDKSNVKKLPDLQLPKGSGPTVDDSNILEIHVDPDEEKFEFKEKTVETISNTASGAVAFSFKKRKFAEKAVRNIRKREND